MASPCSSTSTASPTCADQPLPVHHTTAPVFRSLPVSIFTRSFPLFHPMFQPSPPRPPTDPRRPTTPPLRRRSEEHTSELQSLMRISYAVFCLKKKKQEANKLN